MEENPKEEVLIARDNETGQVGAVVGQNPDGTPKMADVKSTPVKRTHQVHQRAKPHRGIHRQLHASGEEPDHLGIFKMSAADYEALSQPMAEMLNDPETNREMLDKYRVKMKAPAAKSNRLTPTR